MGVKHEEKIMGRFYFVYNEKRIWIDGLLRLQLDSCIYNLKLNKAGDWDIMLLITGDRMVRTGKSTLGQLVGAYFSYRLGIPYTINDVYFDSKDMLKDAMKKPKYSVNHYDEARRGLATSKRMSQVQNDLLDYYAECGQLNQINIIILPDFFTLNEEIAVARSEFLLNVYRGEQKLLKDIYDEGEKIPITKWDRGYFSFFNRTAKSILFDRYRTTHQKNYFGCQSDFNGEFEDFEVLPKDEYTAKKLAALGKYQEMKKVSLKQERFRDQRDKLIQMLASLDVKDDTIAEKLGTTRENIGQIRRDGIELIENALEIEV
jgi:hypothetical protein